MRFGDWLEQAWHDITRYSVLYPLEAAVALFCLLLFSVPELRTARLAGLKSCFKRLAARRWIAAGLIFAFTLIGHYLFEPPTTVPPPGIHDEYSYLLAADTFASGRLTNPPHPMRYFFETFHVLMEPTYMSMYPPGNGLMMAFGQRLIGHPIAGVWIGAALACAALYWMLAGWMPPYWALLGALLAAIRLGWFSYWANSYWGGFVAMLGATLLFGSVRRLMRRPQIGSALAMGLGILILINTRLFEGAVVSAVATLWLLIACLRRPRRLPAGWRQPALLLAIVLLAGGAWMAYYNWRITGHPLQLPYVTHRSRYEVFGSFVWSKPRKDRAYNHDILRKHYYEAEGYREKQPYWSIQIEKPKRAWAFFIGPALTLPLVGLWTAVRSRRLLLVWTAMGAYWAAHLLVPWNLLPHYAAPIAPLLWLLLIEGLRRLRVLCRRRGWAVHVHAPRALVCAVVVMALFRSLAPSLGITVYKEWTLPWYSYGLHANFHRQQIERRLAAMGGKHLVLVQYSPDHRPELEWVYNRADIDGAQIVWARYVADAARLATLLEYFRNRRVWLVAPDRDPNQLLDYKRLME